MSVINPNEKIPRVWIKAFFGFNPEEAGYLGFTKPGDRDSFIDEARSGDLVLIYGSTSKETAFDERRQALGFLEVDLIRVRDIDRMSETAKRNKIANGWEDRWTHAVIVRRAWEISRKIEVKNIAPQTYIHKRARRIASRGALLTESEAVRALQLPVKQANVYGETPVVSSDSPEKVKEIASFFKPSRSIAPSFGERISNYVDGECFLYMMIAKGDIMGMLGRTSEKIGTKYLVKIGYSNDLNRRRDELNAGIPPASAFKWEIDLKSKPFANANSAIEAEKYLKSVLSKCSESMGGEFFLGNKEVMDNAFYGTPGVGFLITGAYRRPKGA